MRSIPELLAALVRLPSVNPMGRTTIPAEISFEHRVTAFLEEELHALGVAVERQTVAPGRDNVIARYTPPMPPPFSVLWECHQDTVPVDGMIIDPFGAVIESGRLYGRGACDVKAGAVAMLTAFARLVREKPPGSAAVTLAFTVDEEHTFLGVQHLMKSGLRTDYAIVAEPTLLNIVKAHKGVVRWQIETSGVACHSSRPEQGINAVYRMARIVTEIEAYAAQLMRSRSDPLLGPPTLSVGMIQGGVSPNTVPDCCRIELDRRLLPGEHAADAPVDLDAFLRQQTETPFTTIPPRLSCPPLHAPGAGPLIQRLGRAIDAEVGRHEVIGVPFGTDASTIADAGIPVVVFGPGDIQQAHTKDEWVELQQVEQAANILYRFASDR